MSLEYSQASIVEAFPGVLGNRGTRAYIYGKQGNKVLKLEEQRNKSNSGELGTWEIKFLIWGTEQFISGEQGNRYPLWMASLSVRPSVCSNDISSEAMKPILSNFTYSSIYIGYGGFLFSFFFFNQSDKNSGCNLLKNAIPL